MGLIDKAYLDQQLLTIGVKSNWLPSTDAIDTLIEDASEWVENECQRKFGAHTISETLYGRGFNRLILDNFPIATINSISFETPFATGTISTSKVRILGGGIIEFKNPIDGPFSKEILYTVNYTTDSAIPNTVKRAVALKVADLLSPLYQGPNDKKSELYAGIEEQIVMLLEKHRRERIG